MLDWLFYDDMRFVEPIRQPRPLARDVPRQLTNTDEERRAERIAARQTFKHFRRRAATETGRTVLGAIRTIRLGKE